MLIKSVKFHFILPITIYIILDFAFKNTIDYVLKTFNNEDIIKMYANAKFYPLIYGIIFPVFSYIFREFKIFHRFSQIIKYLYVIMLLSLPVISYVIVIFQIYLISIR